MSRFACAGDTFAKAQMRTITRFMLYIIPRVDFVGCLDVSCCCRFQIRIQIGAQLTTLLASTAAPVAATQQLLLKIKSTVSIQLGQLSYRPGVAYIHSGARQRGELVFDFCSLKMAALIVEGNSMSFFYGVAITQKNLVRYLDSAWCIRLATASPFRPATGWLWVGYRLVHR